MSANTIPQQVSLADWRIEDPGASGAIPVGKSGSCLLTSAAAETRTLADPERIGLDLCLAMEVDGGAITVTVATAYDENGSTTLVFDDVGEFAMLTAVKTSTSQFVWRVVGYNGVTGPVIPTIDIGGTADGLVLDADGDTSISAPTDDQIDIEAGGVDIVTVNASGLQVTGIAATATTGGGTTGLIPAGASFVTVTSDSADKQCTLPANVVGTTITVAVVANGFEMICADAGAKINDVICGATNEAAIPANTHSVFTCISATEWILVNYTALGAVTTAIIPNTL